jgi:hypothetical protein
MRNGRMQVAIDAGGQRGGHDVSSWAGIEAGRDAGRNSASYALVW